MKKPHQKAIFQTPSGKYDGLIGGIAQLLETARHNAARTVNALMTATYWEAIDGSSGAFRSWVLAFQSGTIPRVLSRLP